MSPRPVSLLVWRDAKSDPPTGDMERRIQAVHRDGTVEDCDAYFLAEEDYVLWAERPVLSDLTDEDVLEACAIVENEVVDGAYDEERLADLHDRLRAALGGEKEET